MKLSILIPVYNEKTTILKVLDIIKKVKLGNIGKEIIIVDDGSTDGTREILKNLNKKNIKIFFHKKNQGKGAAIKTGLKYITGDIILIQDADLEYDPNDYPKLLEPILKGKANIVYGSRFLKKHRPKYYFYYLGNLALNLFISLLYQKRITDMETCYKVFKRDIIKNIRLKAKGFDFEPEITTKIIKKGHKIIEVPIEYRCRSFKEGKKINWKDGIKALWYIIKYRFTD